MYRYVLPKFQSHLCLFARLMRQCDYNYCGVASLTACAISVVRLPFSRYDVDCCVGLTYVVVTNVLSCTLHRSSFHEC